MTSTGLNDTGCCIFPFKALVIAIVLFIVLVQVLIVSSEKNDYIYVEDKKCNYSLTKNCFIHITICLVMFSSFYICIKSLHHFVFYNNLELKIYKKDI